MIEAQDRSIRELADAGCNAREIAAALDLAVQVVRDVLRPPGAVEDETRELPAGELLAMMNLAWPPSPVGISTGIGKRCGMPGLDMAPCPHDPSIHLLP